jgi:predicted outer membrane protein
MTRSLAILALSTVFLSTAAFAQSAAEKTGITSTLGIAPKTADFVKEAAMSDMLEIEAAKIAQQKGDADEQAFAAQMITDHTKTSSELKQMVSGDLKAALPTSLDDSSQKKLGKLRDANSLAIFRVRGDCCVSRESSPTSHDGETERVFEVFFFVGIHFSIVQLEKAGHNVPVRPRLSRIFCSAPNTQSHGSPPMQPHWTKARTAPPATWIGDG